MLRAEQIVDVINKIEDIGRVSLLFDKKIREEFRYNMSEIKKVFYSLKKFLVKE